MLELLNTRLVMEDIPLTAMHGGKFRWITKRPRWSHYLPLYSPMYSCAEERSPRRPLCALASSSWRLSRLSPRASKDDGLRKVTPQACPSTPRLGRAACSSLLNGKSKQCVSCRRQASFRRKAMVSMNTSKFEGRRMGQGQSIFQVLITYLLSLPLALWHNIVSSCCPVSI